MDNKVKRLIGFFEHSNVSVEYFSLVSITVPCIVHVCPQIKCSLNNMWLRNTGV